MTMAMGDEPGEHHVGDDMAPEHDAQPPIAAPNATARQAQRA